MDTKKRFLIQPFLATLLLLAVLSGCTTAPAPLEPIPEATVPPTPTQESAPASVENLLAGVSVLADSLAWSPNEAWLAFTTDDGTVWLMQPGQAAQAVEGIKAEENANLQVNWAPDGTWLLVYGTWGNEYPQWTALWLVEVNAQGAQDVQALVEPVRPELKVHQNDGTILSVSWAADGKSFAYSFQADAWTYDLETESAAQATSLLENPLTTQARSEPFDGVRSVALSPNGQKLALELSCNCPSPYNAVGLVDLDSGEAQMLQGGAHLLGWSPDGRWVTLRNATGDFAWEYTFDVYGVQPGSGQITNLSRSNPKFDPLLQSWEENFSASEYQVWNLKWGPQGEYLYTLQDYFIEGSALPEIPGQGFIAQRNPNILLVKYLPTAQASYVFPAWLSDSSLAYIRIIPAEDNMWGRYPNWQPYILDRPVESGGSQGMLVSAAWSPGGNYLAVVLSDAVDQNVQRLELIGISR